MPPKKGKKKEKRPEEIIVDLEYDLGKKNQELNAVKLNFAQRRMRARENTNKREVLETENAHLQSDLTIVEKDFYDFSSSMNTQYKVLQKFTILKVKELENGLHKLRSELTKTKEQMAREISLRDKIIKEKENRIEDLEIHVNGLHFRMEKVLYETLEKLEERLSEDWDAWKMLGLVLYKKTKQNLLPFGMDVRLI